MEIKKTTISEALKSVRKDKGIIIDVRTPSEFETIHLKKSYNLPLDKVDEHIGTLNKLSKKLFFICNSGNRAKSACLKLNHLGKRDLYIINESIYDFKAKSGEVVKGKEKWAIERQVRFTAGLIVAIGVVLGAFVNSYFYVLPFFVGIGLVFAAVSNNCTMGLLLSKLPYNQENKKNKKYLIDIDS